MSFHGFLLSHLRNMEYSDHEKVGFETLIDLQVFCPPPGVRKSGFRIPSVCLPVCMYGRASG
jgi:hypothetical protein